MVNSRRVGKSLYIDTNRINARKKEPCMNQLEKWKRDGVITLQIPESAYKEILSEKSKSTITEKRKKKAVGHIFPIALLETEDEKEMYNQIKEILFPNRAIDRAMEVDILNLFITEKYCGILVTNDGGSKRQPGGILGHRTELLRLGVRVMRDSEAVRYVKKEIQRRDKCCIKFHERDPIQYPLPDWIGKD